MGNQGSAPQGAHGAQGIANDIESTWSAAGDSAGRPTPREGHAAVCVGSRMFVFGGVVAESGEPHEENDLHVYDTGASSDRVIGCAHSHTLVICPCRDESLDACRGDRRTATSEGWRSTCARWRQPVPLRRPQLQWWVDG